MRYAIHDWMGHCMTELGEFETFEDAWDFILGDLTDRLNLTENDYGEYYVYLVGDSRESRYLDPNDPRSKDRF